MVRPVIALCLICVVLPSCRTTDAAKSADESTQGRLLDLARPLSGEEWDKLRTQKSPYDDGKFRDRGVAQKSFQTRPFRTGEAAAGRKAWKGGREFNTEAYQNGDPAGQRSSYEGDASRLTGKSFRTDNSRLQEETYSTRPFHLPGERPRTPTARLGEKDYATRPWRPAEVAREREADWEDMTIGKGGDAERSETGTFLIKPVHLTTGDSGPTKSLSVEDVRSLLGK